MKTKMLIKKLQLAEYGSTIYVKKRERDVIANIIDNLSYRMPKSVIKYRRYSNGDCFSICPSCNSSIERDYQGFCDVCGQHLKWISMQKMICHKNKIIEQALNVKYEETLTSVQVDPKYYITIIAEDVRA